jgi:hypothetical protein
MQEIVENGHVEEQLPEFQQQYQALPVLPQGALKRLHRMAAGLEGATEVAQAALNAHNQQRQMYQRAFEAACEDASIPIPPGEHDVQIDWGTGDVRFVSKS